MKPAPRSASTVRLWLVAGLLMLAEFLVFDRATSRHHASVYPQWNDQIQYLIESYTAYDEMHAHGLVAGLKFALSKNAVQGTLHDTCAVVVFWVVGSASRSALLSMNLLVFLAWQAALLFTLPRVSGSRTLGWVGFGLVLCLAGPWTPTPGSAVDFRLDHAAMCLFGITACVALLTDGFRSTGWSLAFGLAAAATLLERFLTGAYLAPLFFFTALWLLTQPERWRRLRNLLLAGGVVTLLALPVFWHNRAGIYEYYWVGHITGAESAARVRGFDLAHSIRFVWENLARIHLGLWFGLVVAAVTWLLVWLVASYQKKSSAGLAGSWLFFAGAFLFVPALVLTFHRQKSEIVLGILVPGLVLLVLWLWHQLASRVAFPSVGAGRHLWPALPAVLALGGGLAYFVRQETLPPYSADFVRSANKINQMSDYIYAASRQAGLKEPVVGIDRIVDFVDGRILRVICYERHKEWVMFAVHLPDSILAGPDEKVFFKLKYCDFMIVTDAMPDRGYWPYDLQMRRLYPEVKAWCDEYLVVVDIFSAFDRDMTFYRRPELH